MNRPAEFALDMFARGTPEIANRARSKERHAFEGLVREHAGALFALATRLAADPTDAEDLVQETFLKAWRSIRGFRGESRARTWLYRILLNAARDLARRRRPTARLPAEARGRPGADPADGLARRDLLARVLDAVHRLPRRQRETILLRARGGLSYREIADVLGIRRGVVKLHLVHARKKLAARFGAETADWGIR